MACTKVSWSYVAAVNQLTDFDAGAEGNGGGNNGH